MTTRCAFFPSMAGDFFLEKLIEFKYENGLSSSQRFKSAANLKQAGMAAFPNMKGLEVSRFSDNQLGAALSAFNLKITVPNIGKLPVENLFQSSKVFEHGGPFLNLLNVSPVEAKQDPRLKESGNLLKFTFEGETWPLESGTDFYDFYYLKALVQNPNLLKNVIEYEYFTDIVCNKTNLGFQKGKTYSTQARSCAIAVGLSRAGVLSEALLSRESYWKTMNRTFHPEIGKINYQPDLF